MVTPLRGRDELDVGGLERLIEHILDGGVAGLFILGTTGEGPSLSYRLRRELIQRACRQVQRRVPVLVGITDTAFVESVNLARHASASGADALVLAPPYYMPGGQSELQMYLDHLVAELPLPLFLYNMPALTKVEYERETLQWALGKPQIIGLKDSSGDLNYFRKANALRQARPDWSLFMGPEELLAEAVLAGGHGGVPGGANVFPRLYVQLCDAARADAGSRVQRLHEEVLRISNSLYQIGGYSAPVIKGIKCALACLGICDDFMAEPFQRFGNEERARVRQCLPELVAEVEALTRPGAGPVDSRAATEAHVAAGARMLKSSTAPAARRESPPHPLRAPSRFEPPPRPSSS
jgi:4-hydroxy-tetrahydrodipicolinate synthase